MPSTHLDRAMKATWGQRVVLGQGGTEASRGQVVEYLALARLRSLHLTLAMGNEELLRDFD